MIAAIAVKLNHFQVGAFPVIGDIESLREWIKDGVNGYLVNPKNPDQLADKILDTLHNQSLRQQASEYNLEMMRSRAAQTTTLPKIDAFYQHFFNPR